VGSDRRSHALRHGGRRPTTALVPPDRLYVFSAIGGGVLDLAGA